MIPPPLSGAPLSGAPCSLRSISLLPYAKARSSIIPWATPKFSLSHGTPITSRIIVIAITAKSMGLSQDQLSAITLGADKFHKRQVGSVTQVCREKGDSENVEFKPANMLFQTSLLSDIISEILGSIGETGVLKLSEYDRLTKAIWSDALNELDQKSVKRVLHFVRRGRIQIIDDISESFNSPLPANAQNLFGLQKSERNAA